MAKQLKKFCRITKYIEKTDPKFYEILENLCLLNSFRPRRGHNGLTFLYPSKATIAELDKMQYTMDIDKGCDIVLAHIVHDLLPTVALWNARKGDIPNGSNKKIEVKSIVGNKITLVDGCELEHDDKFKMFTNNREDQTVWRVCKGSLDPSKYTKPATFEHARAPLPGAPRPAPKSGAGARPATHDKLIKLTKDWAASITTGVKCATECAYMVDMWNLATEQKNESALNLLRVIYRCQLVSSYCMLTSTCENTVLQTLDADLTALIQAEVESKKASNGGARHGGAYGKSINGFTKYMEIVSGNYDYLRSKIPSRGGGMKEEHIALNNIINKCRDKAKTALDDMPSCEGVTIDKFLELNLACELESHTIAAIKKHPGDAEDIRREFLEIISARANGGLADLKPETQQLGALVSQLLQKMNAFIDGPYVVYPMGDADTMKDTFDQDCEVACSIYDDTSVSTVLGGMSADALSELFSSLKSI